MKNVPFVSIAPIAPINFPLKMLKLNVYVIANKYPAFSKDEEIISEGGNLYFSTKAVGGHEVIVLKDHQTEIYEGGPELLTELFGVYQNRYLYYQKDPVVEYAMPIHNLGPEAAASIEHPHSQFFASSIIPNLIEDEMLGSKKFFEDKKKCVFCSMVEEEKKQNVRIVSENEDFICFTFFASRFPFEMWILPKDHSGAFENSSARILKSMGEIVYEAVGKLNNSLKFPPFNWWIHTSPTKEDHIDDYYHWHMEIAPRVSKFGGYEMGSIVADTTHDFYERNNPL